MEICSKIMTQNSINPRKIGLFRIKHEIYFESLSHLMNLKKDRSRMRSKQFSFLFFEVVKRKPIEYGQNERIYESI